MLISLSRENDLRISGFELSFNASIKMSHSWVSVKLSSVKLKFLGVIPSFRPEECHNH